MDQICLPKAFGTMPSCQNADYGYAGDLQNQLLILEINNFTIS